MSTGLRQKAVLRTDVRKRQTRLDELPDGTVITDESGHAWQYGGRGYWYRAFDGDGFVSYDLAQRVGKFKVMEAKLAGALSRAKAAGELARKRVLMAGLRLAATLKVINP